MADLQYPIAPLSRAHQRFSRSDRIAERFLDQRVDPGFQEFDGDGEVLRSRDGYAGGVDLAGQSPMIVVSRAAELCGDGVSHLGVRVHDRNQFSVLVLRVMLRMEAPKMACPDDCDADRLEDAIELLNSHLRLTSALQFDQASRRLLVMGLPTPEIKRFEFNSRALSYRTIHCGADCSSDLRH
jgi:hypothetical protein